MEQLTTRVRALFLHAHRKDRLHEVDRIVASAAAADFDAGVVSKIMEKLVSELGPEPPAAAAASSLWASSSSSPPSSASPHCNGEYDDEGVFVYQAFNDDIADWALEHQRLGGPAFNPTRMTWIKLSLAWCLARCAFGRKVNQSRVLKLKLSHEAFARLLAQCSFVGTNKATQAESSMLAAASDSSSSSSSSSGGGSSEASSCGRVQFDPDRDLLSTVDDKGKELRPMLRRRAIQIGLQGRLSAQYCGAILSVTDVTALARAVGDAHSQAHSHSSNNNKASNRAAQVQAALAALAPALPNERAYRPRCSPGKLAALGLAPGPVADIIARLGRGKAPVAVAAA